MLFTVRYASRLCFDAVGLAPGLGDDSYTSRAQTAVIAPVSVCIRLHWLFKQPLIHLLAPPGFPHPSAQGIRIVRLPAPGGHRQSVRILRFQRKVSLENYFGQCNV